MQTRKIGVLDVSVVGLGCNNFGSMIDVEQTRAVVDAAIDAGINYFDSAESLLELAMSWLVSNPLVATVIAGATKPDQVVANVAAAGWVLTPDDRGAVDTITGRS